MNFTQTVHVVLKAVAFVLCSESAPISGSGTFKAPAMISRKRPVPARINEPRVHDS